MSNKPETLSVENTKYIREDLIKDSSPTKKQILVLQRGFVVIADVKKVDNEFHLSNGSHIRRWGTTEGLGELAIKGKQENTKLDYFGESQVHELTVIQRINVDKTKW